MVRERTLKSAVVVFAREPLPGRAKTRLAESIGGTGAARVCAVLLEWTLEVVAGSTGDVVVSLAEEPEGAWMSGRDVRWEVQTGADLGARMREAFGRRFDEGCEKVVIVGSDCPYLRRDHILRAVESLEDVGVALGPASDGGYWLIAQRRPGVDLFTGVPWSSPFTLAATRKLLEDRKTEWFELDQLDDVDTFDDLQNALSDPRIDPDLRDRLLIAWQVPNS